MMQHARASRTAWALLIVAAAMTVTTLAACADAGSRPSAASEDPAIAAIYADADARAAQKRAQQLKALATDAGNATATAAYAPFALQTQTAREIEATQASAAATAASIANAEQAAQLAAQLALAQTATAAPLATANASMAQTATAEPLATQQAQQAQQAAAAQVVMVAAQTAAVAPTATWQAFQMEETRRGAQARTEQESAALSRLLDIAGTSALIVLIGGGVLIVGRQIVKALTLAFTQTTLARATAATSIEQARAEAERERQKAEVAKARAAMSRPPVYVIENESQAPARASSHATHLMPEHMRFADDISGNARNAVRNAVHGDRDILLIWETHLDESASEQAADDLAQTRSIVIDAVQIDAVQTTQSNKQTNKQMR